MRSPREVWERWVVLVVPITNKSKVDLSKGQQEGPNIGVFIVCLILLKMEK